MANVDLMYESKNLATSSEIGTKIRDAPQGDKAVSINEPGKNCPKSFLENLM